MWNPICISPHALHIKFDTQNWMFNVKYNFDFPLHIKFNVQNGISISDYKINRMS